MHKAASCPGAGLPCQQASPPQQQPGLLQRLFEVEERRRREEPGTSEGKAE